MGADKKDALVKAIGDEVMNDKFTCRYNSMIVIEGDYLCGLFVCFI